MIPFFRKFAVSLRPSALVIRRCAIALGGGACAALAGLVLANGALPHPDAPAPAPDNRPIIIDGPPTQVEAAPPPVRPARLAQRPAEPFADQDDEVFETASDAAPVEGPDQNPVQAPDQAAPAQAPQAPQASQEPQERMSPPQPGYSEARAFPQNPCARLSSPADRMVCGYPRLNAEEAALQRVYNMDLYRAYNPEGLREEERRWRAYRDQVAIADGPQGLAEFYAERIQELAGPY